MRKFVSKLDPFNYTIHNLIAHPIMEFLYLIGLGSWGQYVHDHTLPYQHDVAHQHEEHQHEST